MFQILILVNSSFIIFHILESEPTNYILRATLTILKALIFSPNLTFLLISYLSEWHLHWRSTQSSNFFYWPLPCPLHALCDQVLSVPFSPYFLHLSPPSTYFRQVLILFFQHLYGSLLLQSPSILNDASAACHQSGFPKPQISLWYFLNIPRLFDTHELLSLECLPLALSGPLLGAGYPTA